MSVRPTTKQELSLILDYHGNIGSLGLHNGKICKKNIFLRFFTFLGWIKKESNQKIKKRIDSIVSELLGHSPKTYNLYISKDKMLKLAKNFPKDKDCLIVGIFLNKVSKIYTSMKLNNDPKFTEINQFKRKNLKSVAETDIGYLALERKKQDLKNRVKKEKDITEAHKLKNDLLEAKTDKKIIKAKILHAMGEIGKSEKGTTGTALVFDYRKDGSKRLLGVFKPDAKHAPLTVRIHNLTKRLRGQLSLLSNNYYARPQAEKIAYEASQFFELGSLPPSQLVEIGNQNGVFQLAVQTVIKTQEGEKQSTKDIELKEAKELMTPANNILMDPKRKFTPSEIEAFQRFALTDFLIGNLDAHEENWFVKFDQTKRITHILGIDKANSFPQKNPRRSERRGRNQYKWKNVPIAQAPFSKEMREIMKSFSDDKLDQFINRINNKYPDFFDPKIENLMRARVKAIREIADIKGSSPAYLAEMVSDIDFKLGVRLTLQRNGFHSG